MFKLQTQAPNVANNVCSTPHPPYVTVSCVLAEQVSGHESGAMEECNADGPGDPISSGSGEAHKNVIGNVKGDDGASQPSGMMQPRSCEYPKRQTY